MRRVSAWVGARTVPVIVTAFLAVAGAAYSFYWLAAARHGWQSYSDLWNSAGLALDIGHGHFASVYTPSSYLDSPPGLEFLLAPIMVIGHALGLGTTEAQSSTKVFGFSCRAWPRPWPAVRCSRSMRWAAAGTTRTRAAWHSPWWPVWAW